MTQKHLPKEFELHVSTNDVRGAITDASSKLYDWLDLVLADADEGEDDESDFIQFARDVQTSLGRHPLELSYEGENVRSDDNDSASSFE